MREFWSSCAPTTRRLVMIDPYDGQKPDMFTHWKFAIVTMFVALVASAVIILVGLGLVRILMGIL